MVVDERDLDIYLTSSLQWKRFFLFKLVICNIYNKLWQYVLLDGYLTRNWWVIWRTAASVPANAMITLTAGSVVVSGRKRNNVLLQFIRSRALWFCRVSKFGGITDGKTIRISNSEIRFSTLGLADLRINSDNAWVLSMRASPQINRRMAVRAPTLAAATPNPHRYPARNKIEPPRLNSGNLTCNWLPRAVLISLRPRWTNYFQRHAPATV